jgi:energy-coupling factor transporter transmembrane protein EcfT
MMTKEEKKDFSRGIRLQITVFLILSAIIAGVLWLLYMAAFAKVPFVFYFFVALFGLLWILLLLYYIANFIFTIKETKAIKSKDYERALRQAKQMEKISLGKDKEIFIGDEMSVYLCQNDLENAKKSLQKINNPAILDYFSTERVLLLLSDGHQSEAKQLYLNYALKRRNSKLNAERDNVLMMDAIFSHMAGNELTEQEKAAVAKNAYPCVNAFLGK